MRREIAAVSLETVRTVMGNFALCLQQCTSNNGRHLTETVLKK